MPELPALSLPELPAEGRGELRRLPVADPVGDLADRDAAMREHLGGPLHPDPRQVLAERRMPDLRVCALQLAP